MGFNEVREVRTTYTCDFCKHSEVVVSEYGQNVLLPGGWTAMGIVPSAHNPRSEEYPSYSYAPASDRRHCLSSDRPLNIAIACKECSVYGLQVIRMVRAEDDPATKKAFEAIEGRKKTLKLALIWSFVLFWTAGLGFGLGWIAKN